MGAIVGGTVAVAVLVYLWLRPTILHVHQVKSIADGRSIAWKLEQYKERYNRYPDRLAAGVQPPYFNDGWGRPWVYVSDGSTYLLISFGRDGRPDRTDYALLQPGARFVWNSTCREWDRDQIISPLGVHQGCGK